MKVELFVYDECKYLVNDDIETKEILEIEDYKVISGDEAKELEKSLDAVDDFNEYLVLTFKDGSTATYRNSYVDLFIISRR